MKLPFSIAIRLWLVSQLDVETSSASQVVRSFIQARFSTGATWRIILGEFLMTLHLQNLLFLSGWWFGTWLLFFHTYGMSSSQLTNSYFSEGWRKTTNQLSIFFSVSYVAISLDNIRTSNRQLFFNLSLPAGHSQSPLSITNMRHTYIN